MLQLVSEARQSILIVPRWYSHLWDGTWGFTTQETYAMQQNCASMVDAIDAVIFAQAANHSAQCFPITVSEKTYTRKCRRPAVAITVRRRTLDLGLAQPGVPVFTHETQPDGTVSKVYYHREEAHGADEEVYAAVAMVLDTYPDMGRERMLKGFLLHADRLRQLPHVRSSAHLHVHL
jgi:hypothetical protein